MTTMMRWTIIGVLTVVMIGGVFRYRYREAPYSWPSSPFHLNVEERARLMNYFGAAAHHQDYQVTAATLKSWLQSGKKLVMIDVRQPEGIKGFAFGHIRGAHNIPLQWMGQELITRAPYQQSLPFTRATEGTYRVPVHFFPLPKNKPIVVMCYDGNGGEMTPVVLRLLGYQAYGLRYGVASWNRALNVWPRHGRTGTNLNLPLVTTLYSESLRASVTGRDSLGVARSAQLAPFYRALNRSYPVGYAFPWTILPAALYADTASPHPLQVIDLRSPDAYRRGHIMGSINIPFAQLGSNLRRVDPRGQVVLVSQSLQTAAQANAILRLIGYHSYVLKQGLASWNPQENVVPSPHHYAITRTPPE